MSNTVALVPAGSGIVFAISLMEHCLGAALFHSLKTLALRLTKHCNHSLYIRHYYTMPY